MKDLKDHVELFLPTRNRNFVHLRMEPPGDRVSFTLFDDILLDVFLDLGHSPVMDIWVGGVLGIRTAGSTYMVSCSIAPSTDRLSSSGRLPFKPRSKALHTSPQDSPRLT